MISPTDTEMESIGDLTTGQDRFSFLYTVWCLVDNRDVTGLGSVCRSFPYPSGGSLSMTSLPNLIDLCYYVDIAYCIGLVNSVDLNV